MDDYDIETCIIICMDDKGGHRLIWPFMSNDLPDLKWEKSILKNDNTKL